MKTLTRGQVAKMTGIGIEALRFYERKRLIREPPRTASGYRLYPESVVVRLRFIRRAKELGFSLKEIRELLALRVDPGKTSVWVRDEARAKLDDIRSKIRDLQRIEAELEKLTSACRGERPVGECPILHALEGEEDGLPYD